MLRIKSIVCKKKLRFIHQLYLRLISYLSLALHLDKTLMNVANIDCFYSIDSSTMETLSYTPYNKSNPTFFIRLHMFTSYSLLSGVFRKWTPPKKLLWKTDRLSYPTLIHVYKTKFSINRRIPAMVAS